MKEITEALYFMKYTQLMEETSKILGKLDVISKEQGIDIFNPKYGLEEHYINIQEMKGNNHKYTQKMNDNNLKSEPLLFKTKSDTTYSDIIKSNIVKAVDKNIPSYITDINERAKYKEDLIREWADRIVKVTGHKRRSAQELLKGKYDIDADVILIMEQVIPQIDRDDILGNRETPEYYVLEKLGKLIGKNYTLAKDIDNVLSALIRLFEKIDDRHMGDISDYLIPYLDKCFDNFILIKDGKNFTNLP
ncbi:hypothetical protein BACERE00193_04077 [Bacillus paranthracis]|uniref:hypothetical protein n=1 Tax=Bacillus cereus group TaxID=86661 RepID=UPI000A3027E4|nr:hypothetical protein [Bacillus paranthracis]MCR6791552.1 hypothetical protein [Bacillus paranthracis]MED1169541.1 hypothetical protein [Bacillus paranthracis]SME26478.1 hypothetical protein BACERE00193_04077 [Bacillus paranthracis]